MKTIKKIYIASPFFNDEETEALSRVENLLRKRGFEVFSPREHDDPTETRGTSPWSKNVFRIDQEGIHQADCVVLLYWGNYSDSGTAWECGYAFATGTPVVVVHLGTSSNLMIHEGCHTNLESIEELASYDFEKMPVKSYRGKMY